MGNIERSKINKRFFDDSDKARMEDFCIAAATTQTDLMLSNYLNLTESRNGKYINSDLMKMVFDFYASSMENRKQFNMSVSNSAAVLTNELYIRSLEDSKIKKCIYVLGPYGAGKSYFVQSLFEQEDVLCGDTIVYEGSITPPAFNQKIQLAIDNGVKPYLIAINPKLELSLSNIRERARQTGRDVEKKEVIDKFSNFYKYMEGLVNEFPGIDYIIYNKDRNETLGLEHGSLNLNDLNHGTAEEIDKKYDEIMQKLIEKEQEAQQSLRGFLNIGLKNGITKEDTDCVEEIEKEENLLGEDKYDR